MNEVFDLCVVLLVKTAEIINLTYKEINVWIFVIIWPILSVLMIVIIISQNRRIKNLKKILSSYTEIKKEKQKNPN